MYADQIDNELRRSIFLKLCKNEGLNYSQLKPAEIESNQFAYHLKKLKDDGFIIKKERLYKLAPKGLRLADLLSYKTEFVRQQPKLIVVVVAISADGQSVLSGVRNRQPHYLKKVLPGGKIHFGEDLKIASFRTALEFLPNLNSNLSYCGSFRLKFSEGKICFSHIYSEVFLVRLKDTNEEKIAEDSLSSTHNLKWHKINQGFDDSWVDGSFEVFNAALKDINMNIDLEYSY